MHPAIIIEQYDLKNRKKVQRKIKVIGLGHVGFWAVIGFISGYLLAALVAAPLWNR